MRPPSAPARAYCRPASRPRVDGELSVDELHALGHARHSESTRGRRRVVEADAAVGNREFDLVRVAPKRDVELSRATVLDRVLQRLLQDAKQGQRKVWPQALDDGLGVEVDRDVVQIGHLRAQAGSGPREPQEIQLPRVQPM